MATMTRRGAAEVTTDLDKIADLFQHRFATLGVPEKIAQDFAYRCDLLADHIQKHAARVDRTAAENETGESVEPAPANQGFDANAIGDQKPGPLEVTPPVEPFMKGEFTQEKFQALREKQQSGEMASNAAKGKVDAKLASDIQRLASMVMDLQKRLAGEAEPEPEKVEPPKKDAEPAKEEESKKASRRALLRRLAAEEEEAAKEEAESTPKTAYNLFAR